MAATSRQEHDLKVKYQHVKDTTKDPMERLRAQCLSKGVTGIKSIARVFKQVDDNGDKKLDPREFHQALERAEVFLSKDEEKDVFHRIDKDQNGVLDFDEFLIALRPSMSQGRKTLIKKAFNKFDRNGDGIVTVDDMHGVFTGLKHPKYISGEWTEDQVFKKFLDTFDSRNPDGVVTEDEFFDYYVGVSASIDSDCYFDLMMRQAWRL